MSRWFQRMFVLGTACMPGLVAGPAAAASHDGALVPLRVRVEGLALGGSLRLRSGAVEVLLDRNDEYLIDPAVEAGTPLALQVIDPPAGQQCAVSAQAPAGAPADLAPVFVRCVHVIAPSVTMPATLPNEPLSVMLGASAMRPAAYPGLPYESRPGVVGGIFPYEFRLQGLSIGGVPQTVAGVVLDFRTGALRFTPAQSGSHVFTVEIRDSGVPQKILQKNFTIEVDAARFVFVAPTGIDQAGSGSLAAPYQSLAYALARTSAQQLIMLRKGSYRTGGFLVDDGHAKQFIAYPDEVVLWDLDYAGSIDVRIDQAPAARFEGLDFTRVQQYGLLSDPSTPGLVVRRLRFRDAREGPVLSENPAFIHGWGDNSPLSRHRLLVQDNDFGPYASGGSVAYATTLFDAGDSLFENNQLHLGTAGGFHDKDNAQRNTYRQNYIVFPADRAGNDGVQFSAQANSEKLHVHHNLFVHSGIRIGLQCVQETCSLRDHDVHHNTIVDGGIQFGWGAFNAGSFGTRISHNIIQRSTAPYAWHSCLGSVPAAFTAQLTISGNRYETGSAQAMRDTECGGGPMNMSWTTWRSSYAMDTVASGSVVSAVSDLVGAGATLGLPLADPRRVLLGHLYPLPAAVGVTLFGNGFE